MHKYILKLTAYSEAGALTSNVAFKTYDTAQALSDAVTMYRKMRYTNEDGSVGMAMYKVEPKQGEYTDIADWDVFCEVNKVLR